jgi:hypothetical protein
MNKEVIYMALKAGNGDVWWCREQELERFFALAFEAGAAAERNKLADWMMQYGFATGHGDTMEQLCDALGTEIVDRIEMEVDAQREACVRVIEEYPHWLGRTAKAEISATIRARGEK